MGLSFCFDKNNRHDDAELFYDKVTQNIPKKLVIQILPNGKISHQVKSNYVSYFFLSLSTSILHFYTTTNKINKNKQNVHLIDFIDFIAVN